ncbi:S8 family serine peptidase [Bacillus cereus]|uniref:S8 family serine peptidase n=1 Tax=Bacillus cereus TaxID=1396 RepID=UPI000BF92D42|nr:S8 family serine peptidase [Bacillus cereus]PEQ63870.1 hypothetical protein CN469_13865 [Bacillus cereus]
MMKEGQLLITFYEHVKTKSKSQIHTQLGAKKIDEILQLHMEIIEVPVGEEANYKASYEQHPDVRFVDYNAIGKLHYQSCKCKKCRCRLYGCRPNDPYYLEKIETIEGLQNQWGLQRINPEQAFCEVKRILPVTKIAVIDSGIDPMNPDLVGKIIDPINFSSDDPTDYIDNAEHGTHVAGIAAAITNNKIGIASASYNTAYIVPIKVADENLDLFITSVIKGIMYAIDKKVDVINMSFGFPSYSQALQVALEKAWEQGIVLVASAGNDGREQPNYPAAYNFVLGVSATNTKDRLAYFSNWGIYVGITAPGTEILSTISANSEHINYGVKSGTSMSTPFVSGVAAMLRAVKPNTTNQEIIQAIQRSARNLETEDKKWDSSYGYGLLNLSTAVKEIQCSQIPHSKYREISGSFYGQVVDSEGNPIGNILVYAREAQGEKVRGRYRTKCTTYDESETCMQSDGMFRIANLPGGTYILEAFVVDPETGELKEGKLTASIVPGADVYVKLVLSDVPEDTDSTSMRKRKVSGF